MKAIKKYEAGGKGPGKKRKAVKEKHQLLTLLREKNHAKKKKKMRYD